MNSPAPIRCTYCDSVSQWSSEHTEETELAETYECADCNESTPVWPDSVTHQLEQDLAMPWSGPDPME